MKTAETSKEKLNYIVNEYLNEEQCTFLHELINTFSTDAIGKGDIMKLTGMTGTGKVDSAMPIDYVRSIQEIHPNFRTWAHVFDYRNKSFGELTNICEELVVRMNNVLKS